MVFAPLSAGTPLRKYLFILLLTSVCCASVPLSRPSGSRCTCWLISVHPIMLAYILQVISTVVPLCHTCSLPVFVPLHPVLAPRKGPEMAQKAFPYLVSRARVFRAKPVGYLDKGRPGTPPRTPRERGRPAGPRQGPRREEKGTQRRPARRSARRAKPKRRPQRHEERTHPRPKSASLRPTRRCCASRSNAPPQDHHQDPRTRTRPPPNMVPKGVSTPYPDPPPAARIPRSDTHACV